MKKVLLISISMLLVLGLVTGCGKEEKKEEEVKVNTNKEVIKDQKVEGLEMTNTSLVYQNGVSQLITTVTNNTGSDFELIEFIITAKDKDGNVIVEFPGYVGEVIKNGASVDINSSIDIDLSKAAKIEYRVKK